MSVTIYLTWQLYLLPSIDIINSNKEYGDVVVDKIMNKKKISNTHNSNLSECGAVNYAIQIPFFNNNINLTLLEVKLVPIIDSLYY